MDLFFRKFGDGLPLIILHGLFGSSDNWITIGKALAEYFKVYIPDLRNHGNSPFSPDHSYPMLKNDLYSFMRSQNIEKAIIMGHSMGGKTAISFVADYPKKVKALIVVDISPRSYKIFDHQDPQANIHMNIINSLLSVDLDMLIKREDADKILLQTIKSNRIRQFLLKNLHRNHNGTFSWKINLQAIHDNLYLIMDAPEIDKLIKTDVTASFPPVLFIRGAKSNYINDEDIPLIKTLFPMAEIITIPGSDHWLHAQQPDIFMKTLVSFFQNNKILIV